MSLSGELNRQHWEVTRRYFLQLGAAGAAGVAALKTPAAWAESDQTILDDATAGMEYSTLQKDFGTVERGDPLPYTLPLAKRLEVGLDWKTWTLDVVPDPNSNPEVTNPLSREKGNPLTFDQLVKLAEKHAVRFLKIMTCNNIGAPLGMGLWEGVPLREIIWATKPKANIRRVFYYGHHNDDPGQIFRSSLPIGRVLEDPPGDNPVMLCNKLNGQWLSGKRGGPVRMLVPDAYGFKSVKWLKTVMLTNDHRANDTYADANNDIDSWMKTMSRFPLRPSKAIAGEPVPVTGWAQVGVGGLSRVQYWVNPKDIRGPWTIPISPRRRSKTRRSCLRQHNGVGIFSAVSCRRACDFSTATAVRSIGRCATRLPIGRRCLRGLRPVRTTCDVAR